MKHYGPFYAVLLADPSIGHREPLIARLRDPAVPLRQHERDYLAVVLAVPVRWPPRKTVAKTREKMRRAAFYFQFLYENGGKKLKALGDAANECEVDESTIKRSLKDVKNLAGGEWLKTVKHLAKKGPRKRASLHRTY
jgi:hypothetical protein